MKVSRLVSFPLVATSLVAALSGCGSNAGPSAPTPSPSPGPLAIIADRVAGALVTVEVNSQTGALTRIASLTVANPGSRLPLAADPKGRFVYLGYGNAIRSFVVDKTSGQLTERPRVESGFGSASWVAASDRQVYGIFQHSCGTGCDQYWLGYPVNASTGALSGPIGLPARSDLDIAVPDTTGRFVYTDRIGGLLISMVQPDGSVVDVDVADLPMGWPLFVATGPGFLAITDDYGNLLTAAVDDASGRIAPRQRMDKAFGDGYSGNMNTPQIAVTSTGLIGLLGVRAVLRESPVPWSLQTWRVDGAGNLDRRAEVPLPEDMARDLAFDPSGRFLYVAGLAGGVHAFAVAADGGLREIGTYAVSGTGSIVMIQR
jgi:6-phosphogluconolactonase (cycloisomerase 2 family)